MRLCLSLTILWLLAGLTGPVQAELAAPAVEGLEIATLGGGRFWAMEAYLSDLKGVQSVVAGYSGGTVPDPTVRQLIEGKTGHAEVVQVLFDPKVISYRQLLEIFMAIHNPTQRRSGLYRSVILYHNQNQKKVARTVVGQGGDAVVTEVAPFLGFYRADDHHQDYYENHPDAAFCQQVIAPGLAEVRRRFPGRLKN